MTVVQPHLQIFSFLLLPFHLNSGMLGFCLNLWALSGSLQPFCPARFPLPVFIYSIQIWATSTRFPNPCSGDYAGQFRLAPFTFVSGYPWWLSVIISNMSIHPSLARWPPSTQCSKPWPCALKSLIIRLPLLLFFIVKQGLSMARCSLPYSTTLDTPSSLGPASKE